MVSCLLVEMIALNSIFLNFLIDGLSCFIYLSDCTCSV